MGQEYQERQGKHWAFIDQRGLNWRIKNEGELGAWVSEVYGKNIVPTLDLPPGVTKKIVEIDQTIEARIKPVSLQEDRSMAFWWAFGGWKLDDDEQVVEGKLDKPMYSFYVDADGKQKRVILGQPKNGLVSGLVLELKEGKVGATAQDWIMVGGGSALNLQDVIALIHKDIDELKNDAWESLYSESEDADDSKWIVGE